MSVNDIAQWISILTLALFVLGLIVNMRDEQ